MADSVGSLNITDSLIAELNYTGFYSQEYAVDIAYLVRSKVQSVLSKHEYSFVATAEVV